MRRPFLNTLRDQLEAALTAAAFAEERDVETARAILSPRSAADDHPGSSRR
ncbi:MAG TPA: hypothetical protein VFL83_19750 [Anaeromyxobacter sp.]|nr:hypothetical protein [Anaeromyxobacter sp.]